MPTIVFVSPKGGVGKTTAATVLGTELARRASVVMIDADPNRPVEAWARRPGKPDQLQVVSDVNQDNIIDKIDEASRSAQFVLVDCEGTASLTVAWAIGAADLVIVPTQASQLDASQAARALGLVKNQERQARRLIPHRVLFTRSNPRIVTRTMTAVRQQLAEAQIPTFQTHMHEREAFKGLFSFGGTLDDLDATQVPNVPKAIENARAFAGEVVSVLREAA
jgi:chromosome partitioning protein